MLAGFQPLAVRQLPGFLHRQLADGERGASGLRDRQDLEFGGQRLQGVRALVPVREAAYRSAVMEAMYEGARQRKWVAPKEK